MHVHRSILTVASALIACAFTAEAAKQLASAPLLSNPSGQPPVPSKTDAESAAAAQKLNLSNIQSETFVGMKNKKEVFYFFQVNNAALFKKNFGAKVLDDITTTQDILSISTTPNTSVNVAFSQKGLTALNITDDLGDSEFANGQLQDATALGDPGTTNWVSQFTTGKIHGVFLIASDNQASVNAQLKSIQTDLGTSITTVYQLAGSVRPGNQEGHEHFGFLDGISQPAVQGFVKNPLPGQRVVDPSIVVLGHGGDSAPAWAKDSSFLAFRQLKQLVPEFNKFLTDNPLKVKGLTPAQGSALLGARMVGRWKSGAPVDLSPLFDNATLGANPRLNNNFNYNHSDPGFDLSSNQTFCPFSAHIRKTHPRANLDIDLGTIVRAGVPYGPEVSSAEASSNKSSTAANLERGLAFVSYQSVIGSGFKFLQQTWADNKDFFNPGTGVDPIIGSSQVNTPKGQRVISGLDPTAPKKTLTLVTDFVVSRGGEYFLSPSISALKTKFSA